jgi:phosphatidylserine/phosphatidylglycerophosphate/cardiolipin synthase-like enzyme
MPSAPANDHALHLVPYAGDAKTLLAWDLPEAAAADLAGFTIAYRAPGQPERYLRNRLVFEHPDRHAQVASEPPDSSVNAPFHKFRWLHVPGAPPHGGPPPMGTYSYTVTPRYFAGGKLLPLDPALGASADVEVRPFATGSLELAFTRGYVQSQGYVDRFGSKAVIRPPGDELLYDTSAVAGTGKDGKPFTYAEEYAWLGFTAREKVFALLDEVIADPKLSIDMFAYDLNEPDLVRRLLTLAADGRIRLILDDAALHHSTTDPEPEDAVEKAFNKARKAPAEVKRGKFSRYAHDKVMVVSHADDGPVKVLTGSTNFSVTGLYVNSNHVMIFTDVATATEYHTLFAQVFEDDVKTKPFLASPLSTVRFSPGPGVAPPRTITFSPHSKQVAGDLLQAIATRIGQEGGQAPGIGSVLFAVMELDSGTSPVYTALNDLHADEQIFSYGISDNPDGIVLYAPGKSTGVLVTGKPTKSRLPPPFNQVPGIGLGHQIHHKFVICGFNGPDPVVYCGSSNLALGGEHENGDNLIEIHDRDVATAFALEAVALVDHFQFLDRLTPAGQTTPPVAHAAQAAKDAGWFLSTTGRWAKPYFDGADLHDMDRRLFAGA